MIMRDDAFFERFVDVKDCALYRAVNKITTLLASRRDAINAPVMNSDPIALYRDSLIRN